MEDNIRIEGLMNVVKRASAMSRTKETGPGKDIAFETCVQAIIAEDSLENSGYFNDSFRTSQILTQMAEQEITALNRVGEPIDQVANKFMEFQEEEKESIKALGIGRNGMATGGQESMSSF